MDGLVSEGGVPLLVLCVPLRCVTCWTAGTTAARIVLQIREPATPKTSNTSSTTMPRLSPLRLACCCPRASAGWYPGGGGGAEGVKRGMGGGEEMAQLGVEVVGALASVSEGAPH